MGELVLDGGFRRCKALTILIMITSLYPKFLESKRTYNLVQAYWNRLLSNILKEEQYHQSTYLNPAQNGQKEYDGNPVFNAYLPQINRAIRIIQVAPEEPGDMISAWLDDIELTGDNPTPELVIDLKLNQQTKEIATALMDEWVKGTLDHARLEELLKGELFSES